jgi:uncharacterized protein YdeI (YjbR/CyaY-like superfamily)
VIAFERARATGEGDFAVGEEELGLADATGIPEELTWPGPARGILRAHPDLEFAERDPASLTAPAAVHQSLRVGEQPAEGGTRRRRGSVFHCRDEVQIISHRDRDAGVHATEAMSARNPRTGTVSGKTGLYSQLLAKTIMTTDLPTLDIRTRAKWRQWLAKHHASSHGVWLVRYKQHSGVESMPYEDVVREALCFGWIDSLIKRLDDNRYAIKVTPRKTASRWSDINRTRWKELEAAGLLAAPGLAAAPTENSYAPRPRIPELPAYVAKALKTNARAWQHFQALAPRQRRDFVVWIHTAKRAETRERRIRESIELLASGKKLGLR